ncbi:LamG-like jellyroll fold domain-containing protein [Streptomyces thermocoprophilus]|uniref:LamG-like jellyroll fold domain-containing protein n=1 Tax=Streptomyces thermocoprophilus TaxID=78356 RepID=A0ABV5V6W5_9ACTN
MPAAEGPPQEEAQRALKLAEETGQKVEVESERGERTSVFANPDGFSFTLEHHSVPVRVAEPGGGWQSPDATLERRADGTIGPRASSARMAFSGGADEAPLARISEGGRSLELDWKGELPTPILDGASAVYREVLPGVDLKLTATAESFQQVFVVKTPQAAANPALEELTFDLKTEGLTVRKGATGNLVAVDGGGRTVFRSPPARMWDSAGTDGTAVGKTSLDSATPGSGVATRPRQVSASGDGPAVSGDPSEQAASGTSLEPGQGDNVTRMDVKVTGNALLVVPDADMLTTTPADAFPVFIDPTVTWGESERTLLRSDGYESYGWGNGSDNNGQGVGKCGSWNGYYCGPGYVQRLYFEFAPDSLKGKRVLDATFAVTEPWAFQCSARLVDLVRTGNISSATTWASRPKELDWMVDRWVSAGRGSLCDPDSPDAPIEFNDNPEEPNENLTPTVRDFAAGKFSRLTLELRANDESDTSAWKRFRNDAVLRVVYVAVPAKPTGVGILGGSGTPLCLTDAKAPAVISDPTPALTSTPQTAAGGESGAKLRAWFRIEQQASGGSWSGSGIAGPSTGFVGDNIKVTTSWPDTLQEGGLYRYSSLTQVFYDNGTHAQSSGYTNWCYFKVDPTAPKKPTIAFGGPYIACVDDCTAAGGPGVAGSFTFGPAAEDADNKQYEYRLSAVDVDSQPAWTALPPGTVTARVVPPMAGTYVLSVRARDVLGRLGEIESVKFKVAKGDDPVGLWHFDETTGLAADSAPSGGAADAVLASPATRDDRGRRGLITRDAQGLPLADPVTDQGLALDGTTGYAATGKPVLATDASYTVSAWVRLTDGTRNATALGQDPAMSGGWYSAFYLGYRADSKKWELLTSPKDATDGNISTQVVRSVQPAALGAWTHLAAVYDHTGKVIKLYVNGELQGTQAVAPSWSSTGRLQIGRVWWRGAYHDYWKGSIDEVTAWQKALTDEEIADDADLVSADGTKAVELVAAWSAAGAADGAVSLADTISGYGRTLALQGGASVHGELVTLDGVKGAASADAPVIDATGSFTVTTQVAVDRAVLADKPDGFTGQVVGERAANGSSWGLWFKKTGSRTALNDDLEEVTVPEGRWYFGRLNGDGTLTAVQSDEAAALDAPVRLTGIFDAHTGKIALRVGTGQNDDWQQYTARPGTGEITVGAQRNGTTFDHCLAARVSDVRIWAGAMNDEDQISDLIGS